MRRADQSDLPPLSERIIIRAINLAGFAAAVVGCFVLGWWGR